MPDSLLAEALYAKTGASANGAADGAQAGAGTPPPSEGAAPSEDVIDAEFKEAK